MMAKKQTDPKQAGETTVPANALAAEGTAPAGHTGPAETQTYLSGQIKAAQAAADELAKIAALQRQAAQLPALQAQAEREGRAQQIDAALTAIRPGIEAEIESVQDEASAIRVEFDRLTIEVSMLAARLRPYRDRLVALDHRVNVEEVQKLRAIAPIEELGPAQQTLAFWWQRAGANGAFNTLSDQNVSSRTQSLGLVLLQGCGLSAMPRYRF
ncbi:MAG: hypothetical protein M1546_19960 [Chloroflexi bacterium]|nr:hypothetical protein [Chloroflexota bacterium]